MAGMRVEVRYFSWSWSELPSDEGAAFAEQWTYDEDDSLMERKRVPLAKKGPTFSTDPRAGAIQREELGVKDRLGSMGAPDWAR